MSTTKQRTFKVNNQRITIKSRPQTYCRNLSGWYVFVNGKKHFVNTLTRESAEDIAYIRFVNALPTPEAIKLPVPLMKLIRISLRS